MKYTLILYQSSGYNSCKGCVMEEWDSDFSLDTNVTEEEAILQIAAKFAEPSDGGGYTAYLISARGDEQVIYTFEQDVHWSRESTISVSTSGPDVDWNEDPDPATRIRNQIITQFNLIIKSREEALKKVENDKAAANLKQKEFAERKQLEALKQKYEGK